MNKQIRYTRHISTEGNLGFVASGTALYSEVESNGTIIRQYNVTPKRLVMWVEPTDGSIPTAIVPADLTAADDLSRLKIAVGYSSITVQLSQMVCENLYPIK